MVCLSLGFAFRFAPSAFGGYLLYGFAFCRAFVVEVNV